MSSRQISKGSTRNRIGGLPLGRLGTTYHLPPRPRRDIVNPSLVFVFVSVIGDLVVVVVIIVRQFLPLLLLQPFVLRVISSIAIFADFALYFH